MTTYNSPSHKVLLGEELYLQCNFVGVPAPTVLWFHNEMLLSDGVEDVTINLGDDTISIFIGAMKHTSGGTYTCRANNSLGTDQESYSVRIVVGKSDLRYPHNHNKYM